MFLTLWRRKTAHFSLAPTSLFVIFLVVVIHGLMPMWKNLFRIKMSIFLQIRRFLRICKNSQTCGIGSGRFKSLRIRVSKIKSVQNMIQMCGIVKKCESHLCYKMPLNIKLTCIVFRGFYSNSIFFLTY